MAHRDRLAHTPMLDRASIGISFVDILFALVVGQALKPVGDWASDPHLHRLPSQSALAIAVALVLTITSWVGYHNSAKRAHFRLEFVNVEIVKFCLEILMVIVYYVVASNASRATPSLGFETGLIAIAFGLYILWDLAGAYQRRRKSTWWTAGTDNPYYTEWERVKAAPERHDVLGEDKWRWTNWARFWVTVGATVAAGSLYAIVQVWFAGRNNTTTAIVVNSALFVILLTYRVVKELPGAAPAVF